ncbi:MAG: UDP-N-acetylmuramoyl-tripeptide--D-alanyl-D-alanine ligase [Verrucomicrobia bacterium]|nr:UDP-N-acetylmuramoyl-tripeptide--D-alanyl-D-alanine ligase [Verrucomicrobiota bacterium]
MYFLKNLAELIDQHISTNLTITTFAYDSRLVTPGALFFALKGEKSDGHSFLKEVAAKGAACAIVDQGYRGETFGLVLLRVPKVLDALQMIARKIQEKRNCRVVAVTGSVGKTTTKEFLWSLLSSKWKVAKTPGNANTQITFPISLIHEKDDADILVAEMGMSKPGELARLVTIAPPEVAVVTNIGHAHVGYFADGKEGIAREKAQIFANPKTKIAFIHEEAMQYSAMHTGSCVKKTFGMTKGDFVLHSMGDEWKINEGPHFTLPFTEKHICVDFLAAAVAAHGMGMSWEEIAAAAPKVKMAPLRFEKIEHKGMLIINDSYNASYESMQAALTHLPKPRLGGKTIFVFGEMPQLGSFSQEAHQSVAKLALTTVDHALLFGKSSLPMLDVFSKGNKPAEYFSDLLKLQETLLDLARPGDVILIKGANINKMWQILDGFR